MLIYGVRARWKRAVALGRAAALGATIVLHPFGVSAMPVGAATAPEPTGDVREFQLTAEPGKWEISPGIVTDAWTYNGQVPGPELRVREGDLFRVTVANKLPVPTTVHWHGVDVPNAMDGVPGLTQNAILPNETFTYEFTATNPGTRWYHSHQDSNAQLELGLFGPLIIAHRDADPNGTFDRDFTLIFDEKALDFTPAVAMGGAQIRNANSGNGRGGLLQYDLFTINSKAGEAIPPIVVKEGERVRLRLINVGNLVHAIHLHGHSFKIIATDGNPVPPESQWLKDTVTIGPAERYDLEVWAANPGYWMLHCHMPNHADNGMTMTLEYEGVPRPVEGSHATRAAMSQTLPAPAMQPPHAPPTTAPEAPAAPTLPPTPGSAGATPAGAGADVAIVDNRYEPRSLNVAVGTPVKWQVKGLNIHSVTSADGAWDSGMLSSGQSFSITFDKPGTYSYFCRQHALNGQFGIIEVK